MLVNIPFCGSMMEAPALAEFFLQYALPANPTVQRVKFFCSDVRLGGTATMVSTAVQDSRLHFDVKEMDLGSEQLPVSTLAIGLHPQPLTKTPPGLWENIIANVLRSSERCLFTCWMKSEADELQRMCHAFGYSCTLQRNPSPLPEGVSP